LKLFKNMKNEPFCLVFPSKTSVLEGSPNSIPTLCLDSRAFELGFFFSHGRRIVLFQLSLLGDVNAATCSSPIFIQAFLAANGGTYKM